MIQKWSLWQWIYKKLPPMTMSCRFGCAAKAAMQRQRGKYAPHQGGNICQFVEESTLVCPNGTMARPCIWWRSEK